VALGLIPFSRRLASLWSISCTLWVYSDVETRKGSKKQLRALLHILTQIYSIMSLAMGYEIRLTLGTITAGQGHLVNHMGVFGNSRSGLKL
jgi:CRP-like cAMP-binding protein